MVIFTRLQTSKFLYTLDSDDGSVGWVGYLLPTTIDPGTVPSSLDLKDSFTQYPGTYLFSYTAPILDTDEITTAFISSVRNALGSAGPSMVWLLNLSVISATTICYLSYRADGTVAIPLSTFITSDLTFGVSNSSIISVRDDAFFFAGGMILTTRNGIEKWKISPDNGLLMMSGKGRGTFDFTLYLNPRFDFDLLEWELRYCIPQSATNPDPANVLQQRYPLVDTSKFAGNIMIGMSTRIDPTKVPDKDRTFMAFTGQSCTSLTNSGCNAIEPTLLYSTFVTDAGHPINWVPVGWNDSLSIDPDPSVARLVFTPADFADINSNVYYMTPCGHFRLGVAPEFVNASAPPALLAGTSGTETIGFTPFTEVGADDGDLLAFVPYQPGYAPVFPLPETSPTGPPPNIEPLLNANYQTAWANVLQSSRSSHIVGYYSQPIGASLYNDATALWEKTKEYLGYFETPVGIDQSSSFCFPIVSYSLTAVSSEPNSFSFSDIPLFETSILNPQRKQIIQQKKQPIPITHTLQRRKVSKIHAAKITAEPITKATTPQGLLASIDTADSSWLNLLLAKNQVADDAYSLQFENLLDPLGNAFQSNQLLLVVTDGKNLGTQGYDDKGKPVDPPLDPTAPVFDNLMAIEEWLFSVVTPCSGESSTNKPIYDNYNNVMIFKFCKGTLVDLVQSPKGWTHPLDFNDDSIGVSGLTGVASWISDYFDQAQKDVSLYPEYLQNFCQIINNPNWNGILTLKADVASLPSNIQGLMAGVVYPEKFYAHHFGIEINPVETSDDGAVDLSKNSSLFGLINYVDTDYATQLAVGKGVNQPVPPRPGSTYDFKVLYLQSLFVNSAVAKFGSKTQLTCNQLYNEVVNSLNDQTDIYNSMIIDGTYQNQNGKSVYVFETNGNNAYGFGASIFNVLNFTEGQFNTVADGSDGSDVISLFSLTGKFDFRKIKDLDMFSFGSEGSASVTDPKGLAFTNVFIRMTSSSKTNAITSMLFDTASITFNVQESDTRENSLYPNFALDINGLISGSVDSSPDSKGFLRLQSDAKITGTVGTWYALDCALNMGSPGALASSAGFVSSMALCWSPSAVSEVDGDDPSYKVYLGLKLPGSGGSAKLLSLQGVLKLTIGEMKLSYINDQQAYMLMLYDIALKFLGLVQIPPLNGRTSFYLFGGPQGSASKVSELGWYAVYNVAPTPSSDGSQKVLTSGGEESNV